MLYVEDVLNGLNLLLYSKSSPVWNEWNVRFITNVSGYLSSSQPLSENQSAIILKLAFKLQSDLAKVLNVSDAVIKQAITNPVHKNPTFKSRSVKREVRYAGQGYLVFRFKMDDSVSQDIKSLRGERYTSNYGYKWLPDHKLWKVRITGENFPAIERMIARHKFEMDEDTKQHMSICAASVNANSHMFIDDSDLDSVYVNVCNNPVMAIAITNCMNGDEL